MLERFFKFVSVQPSGCWLWTGTKNRWGYGMFSTGSRTRKPMRKMTAAHIVSWDIHKKSETPKGLELDHLCRNRSCVNPDHLEPVTRKESVARGISLQAENMRKTHCVHGHELNAQNTYRSHPGRNCRICNHYHNLGRRIMQELRLGL